MSLTQNRLMATSDCHCEYVNRLVNELNNNTSDYPRIIEDYQPGGYFHVTVIWDDWHDVEPLERGQIIMDAYEQVRPSDVLKITITMGLTTAEAERLGIAS
ncbi:MAG: hypothetical protein NTX50_00130 [Candidatus Sumerlaeota bacterium]|nr:hypothetical protein [Candidatus Sumerlaeota bacterium]